MKYPCFPGSVLKKHNLTLSLVINLPLPHAMFLTRSFLHKFKIQEQQTGHLLPAAGSKH